MIATPVTTQDNQTQAPPSQDTAYSLDTGTRRDLPLDEYMADDLVEPFASEAEAMAFIDHFATKALVEAW